jgi:hypothetical protein
MLLMFPVGAQAVHVLLFFSHSAASSAAEPLITAQAFAGRRRPRARAGPGRSSGGEACAGRIGPAGVEPGSSVPAWRCGPGRTGLHLDPARLPGVSVSGGGGCGASRLRVAGLRPHCSHPTGSWCFLRCSVRMPAGVPVPCVFSRRPGTYAVERGPLGALRRCAATLLRAFARFICCEPCADRTSPGSSASSPAGAAGCE